MTGRFDVFLSHNSHDKPVVEEIAHQLKARGLEPWLDKWELRPGFRWQEGLEKGMEDSRAVAVFIGADGLGPWEAPEMRDFIDRSTREPIPVIPVLLPGAPAKPELPRFLRAFCWVDLRGGVTDDGLGQLLWGITGSKPGTRGAPPSGQQKAFLHNLPYPSLGADFKGREDLLDELARDLEHNAATAIVQPQAIHGLGGIGKTRLAVEYALRSAERYTAAFFVHAESRAALRAGLARLAGRDLLDLNLPGVAEDEVVAAVRAALRERSGWLLILDNVDTEEAQRAVRELMPLSGGQLLITSRLTVWPPGVRRRSVDVLPRPDAVKYLLDRTAGARSKTSDDARLADEIAAAVGDLPLALELAAAYISVQGAQVSEYAADWDRSNTTLLSWHDGAALDYPFSIAASWMRTLSALSVPALALMRLLAYLASEPIPVQLLEAGRKSLAHAVQMLRGDFSRDKGSEDVDVRAALSELVRYSLVTRGEGVLTLHRMSQEAIRAEIEPKVRKLWVELAVRFILDFAPADPDDVRTWPVWDSLRPHAEKVVKLADAEGNPEPTSVLMGRLGMLLYFKSLYTEAEPLMRRALALEETYHATGHPTVACHLNNLALLLQETNRFAEAEQLLQRALVIDEAFHGAEHPEVAGDLNNLVMLLLKTGRAAEAEPLIRRSLAIAEASFGPDHPKVAITTGNLAYLLQVSNRPTEAEALMRRALTIDEAFYGADHPSVARHFNNLALLLQATNRLVEAEPLMRRALSIDEEAYGPEHPEVARDLNNLAHLLQGSNRLTEAEPLVRRALAICEESYGPQHPDVARVLGGLATLLLASRRLAEAEPLMRRALAICEASYGREHPDVGLCLNNLAKLLRVTNTLAEAEPLAQRAVSILEARLGPDHPNSRIARRNLELLLAEIEASRASRIE